MKRTGFKRKTKLRRVSKSSTTKLKRLLWEECKRIIRKRYVKKDGTWDCYTCGSLIDAPHKAHTAHFIPSAACGAYLRYDLRNLRVCCYHCNINLGGNGASFYRRLVQDHGQDYVDQIFKDKQKIIKSDKQFYEETITKYRDMERC